MAQRIVLHIGVMKSGTSYLQRLLVANRTVLADRGVLFPGRSWADQVRAVSEVTSRKRVVAAPPKGAWRALVDEMDAWPGAGLVSMEYLAPLGPPRIEAVVSSLAQTPVQVVVTVRDLGRAVPAMWQETLKNGRDLPFDEYVAAIAAREGLGRRFWREQDLAAICERWAGRVGPEQLVVVTVPAPGAPPAELWHRFAAAVDLDPTGFEEPGPANESLGAASAEVLRHLNERLEGMDYGLYAKRVKQQLAKQVLAGRRGEEPAVGFDPPEWLCDRSAAMVEWLRGSGLRLVGDLADLTPRPVPGVAPSAVPVDDQLAAAVAGIAGLVRASKGRRATGR